MPSPPIISDSANVTRSGLGQHIPALDGVRGLAVLLVLCYDCLKIPAESGPLGLLVRKISASGWIGVDLFFVLSGFLITGILLDTAGRRGYWSSFLARRSLRIFPLYYATLAVVFLVLPGVAGALEASRLSAAVASVRADQAWYWVYGQNWLYAFRGAWPEERVLNHFWSLAIEEQFYLVWPLVVWRVQGRKLAAICLGLSLYSLLARTLLLHWGAAPVTTYVLTLTRMDSLCAGALLAIGLREAGFSERWLPRMPWLLAIAGGGLLGLDLIWPVLKSESYAAGSFGHTGIAIVFTLLIGSLLAVPAGHLGSRLFRLTPLRSLGQYSYAIYVFHRGVYAGLQELNLHWLPDIPRGVALFLGTILLTYLLARLSWLLIEQPFLSLKKFCPRPETSSPPPVVEPSPRCGPVV